MINPKFEPSLNNFSLFSLLTNSKHLFSATQISTEHISNLTCLHCPYVPCILQAFKIIKRYR